MADSPFDDDRLGPLMDEFLERTRRGERLLVSEYAARHPELSSQIRELFPAIAMLEQAEPERPGGQSFGQSPTGVDGQPLRQLGDYQIVREIGRGGMGVVYEAIQESLGRHVALKVLPWQHQGDSQQLNRFRREARIAAALHHSNIAPVFGIGEHQGVAFFAMQYIRGSGLDEVLVELRSIRAQQASASMNDSGNVDSVKSVVLPDSPVSDESNSTQEPFHSPRPPSYSVSSALAISHSNDSAVESERHYFRRVAEIGQSVADALQYAHSQGVLHRDIKPSNVMLDTQGAVWVTDFGLAKQNEMESDSSKASNGDDHDGDELTRTGDLIGTMRYMPPERFRGVADGRGDIYSLGLTLYELLTLRPAFAANSRAELVELVSRAQLIRPRRIEPRIPRDLETIVLKAVEADAANRYQSPAAMADDLRRYLADRPIVARRSSAVERGWRWCRRNPAVAGLCSVVALLLIVIAAGSMIALARLNSRHQVVVSTLDKVKTAERQERKANRRAGQRLFDALFSQAIAGQRSDRPGRRYQSLSALRNASAMSNRLALSDQQILELRNEAISAMALVDIAVDAEHQQGGATSAFSRAGFSPDGEMFARVNAQGRAEIVRLSDNAVVQSLSNGWDSIEPPFLGFDPSGRRLGIGGGTRDNGNRIVVVSVAEGNEILAETATSANKWSQPFAFSNDGRLAAMLGEREVVVFDLDLKQQVGQHSLRSDAQFVRLCPDGDHVAVGIGNRLAIFDWRRNGKMLYLDHADKLRDADWSKSGRYLATASGNRSAYVWDLRNLAEPLTTYRAHTSKVLQVRFSPDDRAVMSTAWDASTKIWDPWTGKTLLTAGRRGSNFSLDGKYLGFESAGRYWGRWTVSNNRLCQALYWASGEEQVSDVAFHPDGGLLAAIVGGRIVVRAWPSGTVLPSLAPHQDDFYHLAFSADGEFLYATSNQAVDRWSVRSLDVNTQETPRRERFYEAEATQLDITVDALGARLAFTGQDRIMVFAKSAQVAPKTARTLVRHPNAWFVELSPDGELAAVSGKFMPRVIIVQTRNGQTEHSIEMTGAARTAFSADGLRLAVSRRDQVDFYDVETWERLESINLNRTGCANVAFDAQNALFAVHERGHIRLHRSQDLSMVAMLRPPLGESFTEDSVERVDALCFSGDGRYLVTGTHHGVIYAWDLGRIRHELGKMGLDWNGNLPRRVAADSLASMSDIATRCQFNKPASDNSFVVRRIKELTEKIDNNASDVDSIQKRAQLHKGLYNMEAAHGDFSLLVELEPNRPKWLIERAWAAHCLSRHAAANRDYEHLLAIPSLPAPDRALVCNNYAWTLLFGPHGSRDFKKALRLADKSVEHDASSHWSFANTRGLALYYNGRLQEAQQVFEANLETRGPPTLAFDWFGLALCHQGSGRGDLAAAAWDTGVSVWQRGGALPRWQQAELRVLCFEAAKALRRSPP